MSDVPPGWGLAGSYQRTGKKPISFADRVKAEASASISRTASKRYSPGSQGGGAGAGLYADELNRKKSLVPARTTTPGRYTPTAPTRPGQTPAVITDGAVGVNDPTSKGLTAEQLRLVAGFSTFFKLDDQTGGFFDATRGETIGQPVAGGLGGSGRFLAEAGALGVRSAANGKGDVGNLQGLSVRAAANFLYGMNSDELTQFQVQLRNAGFFGNAVPTWGWLDQETRDAFAAFVSEGMALGPGKTIREMMQARSQAFLANPEDFGGQSKSKMGSEVLDALQPDIVPVTAASTLQEMVDKVAQQLLGQNLPREKRDEIVDQLQSKERQQYYATTGAKKQQALDTAFKKNPSTGETELDAFAAVVAGNESGGDIDAYNPSGARGKYQILDSNWPSWAREAGVDPNDRSEAAQDQVAKHKMAQMYNAYGNWRDVAIAWYAGGGTVDAIRAGRVSGDGSEGDYPTINQYADLQVRQMQERLGAGSLTKNNGGVSYTQGPTTVPDARFVEQYDPQTEVQRLVRAANPAGFGASQWKSRADAFFQMLGPTVNYGF